MLVAAFLSRLTKCPQLARAHRLRAHADVVSLILSWHKTSPIGPWWHREQVLLLRNSLMRTIDWGCLRMMLSLMSLRGRDVGFRVQG